MINWRDCSCRYNNRKGRSQNNSSIELFSPQVPIRPFMSSSLVTGSCAMNLSKAIEIMSKKNIRRLPITDKDSVPEKLIGIITEKDIVNAIVKRSRNL
jgi:CBS domain-containing protein